MTEDQWRTCTDPTPMLEFVRGRASDRKLRLFGCACCRRIWSHLAEKRGRWLVEVSERYADGRVTRERRERLERAWHKADDAFQGIHLSGGGDVDQNPAQAVLGLGPDLAVEEVTEMAAATLGAVARGEVYDRIWRTPGKEHDDRWAEDEAVRTAAAVAEGRVQADLLRDIVAPFGRATPAPSWLTSTVVALATGIYDERAFGRLPILADALQDAGCTNEDVLNHLRDPGEHARGCWVLDLLLGKE
jgi:hypothetical protein